MRMQERAAPRRRGVVVSWVAAATRIPVLLALVMLALPLQAQEGKAPWEEYDKRLTNSRTVQALGTELFGDQVSLANGELSFDVTDVALHGNNALRVAVGRSYRVYNKHKQYPDYPFGDWELEVPRISGTFAPDWVVSNPTPSDQRCSRYDNPTKPLRDYQVQDFWHGNALTIPGVGGGELLLPDPATPVPTTGDTFRWVTADHIWLSCIPARNVSGEGFLAITPDGTRYWFDWMAQYDEPKLIMPGRRSPSGFLDPNPVQRRKNVLYATRVQDRFGNTVEYTYTNAWNQPAVLTGIVASDGRSLAITYSNGRIAQVRAGTRTWSYGYGATPKGKKTLTQVTQPDATRWTINFAALTDAYIEYRVGSEMEPSRGCTWTDPALNYLDEPVGTLTHPSGAVGTFKVGIREHGRSNVPLTCANVTTSPSDGYPGQGNDPNDDMAVHEYGYETYSLLSKTLSGTAAATRTWTYAYAPNVSFYLTPGATVMYPVCNPWGDDCWKPRCLSDDCAGASVTTVQAPDGSWKRYHYGNSYRYNEGKLLKVEHGTGSTVLRAETSAYDLSMTARAYPVGVGDSPSGSFPNEHTRPLLGASVVQDGVTFSRTHETFDVFARPLRVKRASSLGHTRTDETAYHDDFSRWVIGQVARVTNLDTTPNVVLGRTDYDGYGMPWKVYGPGTTVTPGLLSQTLAYDTAASVTSGQRGTLASVTDGRGNVTALSGWKRGIPQLIKYPATPESVSGTSESAVVDDNGDIASVTDENGHRTCYAYDTMGRLSQVTYPSETQPGVCDTSKWAQTTISFTGGNTAAYGVPAGHWRQTTHTGNARHITIFDAFWRPIVEQTVDLGNVSATLSEVVKRYDASGHLAFQSYPMNTGGQAHYADTAHKGTHTTHDALGRITRVEQDSELGRLVTATAYLTGFRTRVTHPRGMQTLTEYVVLDQPSHDWPTSIDQPEGVRTVITRDVFGKPLEITRSGPGG